MKTEKMNWNDFQQFASVVNTDGEGWVGNDEDGLDALVALRRSSALDIITARNVNRMRGHAYRDYLSMSDKDTKS